MRRILPILILGLYATGVQAQSYFNIRDPLYSFAAVQTSVVVSNGRYYTTGMSLDSNGYISGTTAYLISGIKYVVYDEAGHKVRDTIYQLSHVQLGLAQGRDIQAWPNSLQIAPDGNFILAAYSRDYDSPRNIRAALIKLDTMGRCTMFREYDKPFCQSDKGDFSNHIRDLKPDGYGGWLLLTQPLCKPSPTFFRYDYALTKLDSAFNVVWSRQYGNVSNNSVVTKVVVESYGYLLAGGLNNVYHTSLNFVHQAQLIKTDTAGNEQWRWLSDPAKKIYSAADVVRTPDGGYLYCGTIGEERFSANGQSADMYWKGWIEKLDAAHNPQWSKTLGNAYRSSDLMDQNVVRLLPNGDVVVAGQYVDSIPAPDWGKHYGSLMRIAQDGIVRWHRRHSFAADTFQYQIHDMKRAPDGGFIMTGQSVDRVFPYQYPTQRGWIIKVDSNGCMSNNDPQCWPASVTPIPSKASAALVFPNPAKSVLNIRYTATPGRTAAIYLTDYTGRKALWTTLGHRETALNILRLTPGLYLWRITEGGTEMARGKFIKQ